MQAKRSFCLSKHHHGSRSEADYCNWLLARKQNREIKGYELYPSVALTINGRPWKTWKIDFKVFEKDGTVSYHESKGWNRSDDVFKLKRDAFLLCCTEKLYVNKVLYTGQVDKKRHRWTLREIIKRNKRAAQVRKMMRKTRMKDMGFV